MTYESPYAGFVSRQMTFTELERELMLRVPSVSQLGGNTTIQVNFGGLASYSGGGTLTAAQNGNGQWINMASAATTGQLAARAMGIGNFQFMPSVAGKVETGSDITSQRLYLGMGYHNAGAGVIANGTDNLYTTGDFIGFRYSTSASDPSWTAIVSCISTSSQTTYATGVPVTASTLYGFALIYLSSTQVLGYIATGIDSPLAGPFPMTIPSGVSTTTSYGVQSVLENTANAARALRWGRFWSSRR